LYLTTKVNPNPAGPFRTSVHKSYETELELLFTELTSREFEKTE